MIESSRGDITPIHLREVADLINYLYGRGTSKSHYYSESFVGQFGEFVPDGVSLQVEDRAWIIKYCLRENEEQLR